MLDSPRDVTDASMSPNPHMSPYGGDQRSPNGYNPSGTLTRQPGMNSNSALPPQPQQFDKVGAQATVLY